MHNVRDFLIANLIDPVDSTVMRLWEDNKITFLSGREYPIKSNTPIIIDNDRSLFSKEAILSDLKTTQDRDYHNLRSPKNFIRKKLLPTLSNDTQTNTRYKMLAESIKGKPVLIIGAGEKSAMYRKIFEDSLVITSDVHLEFGVDIVLDAHHIPFQDSCFGLVLAGQVLEHTIWPWQVTKEIQRVTRLGGLIQIETPFMFPYHGAPYDFYRFTPSALRALFSQCDVIELIASEGTSSAAAVSNANVLIYATKSRLVRRFGLVIGRFIFGWMKYLDRIAYKSLGSNLISPKGFAATFRKTQKQLTDKEVISDITRLINGRM